MTLEQLRAGATRSRSSPLIRSARTRRWTPAFKPGARWPPPTDADNVAALNGAVDALDASRRQARPGPAPKPPSASPTALTKLADGDAGDCASKREDAFIPPLKTALDDLRAVAAGAAGDARNLPPDLTARLDRAGRPRPRRGRCRRAIRTTTRCCARSRARCSRSSRRATGGPISILESGNTIVRAFFEAGVWALLSIAILLWIVLRRFSDVLLTLIPLLLAGVVTLEICVLIGMPLNFANIIALPLLLGVGVAFKIYYIMAWRAGQTNLLQSSLTRAVFYSALATATAFGSLWLSSHPGTSSMGKLLALSLV